MYHAIGEFTLAGALMVIGVLTLSKASEPREVPFALLPFFFGLHEFAQGIIWLGMEHLVTARAMEMAQTFYIFYAKGLLQFWVPFAIWSLEPVRWRKQVLLALTVLGISLTIYSLWGLSIAPNDVYVHNGWIIYNTPGTDSIWLALGYVLTTCGALMLSSSIAIQLYGFLNFAGLGLIYLIRPYAFTTIWCLFAALISGVLYFYFIERRISFLQHLRHNEYKLTKKLSQELYNLQLRYPALREKIYSISRSRFRR